MIKLEYIKNRLQNLLSSLKFANNIADSYLIEFNVKSQSDFDNINEEILIVKTTNDFKEYLNDEKSKKEKVMILPSFKVQNK